MKNLFIHLRLHSNFSLAEGMLSFDDLSNFCVKNNQPAIAITDTNNLFGALEFSLKMISCGIQPNDFLWHPTNNWNSNKY